MTRDTNNDNIITRLETRITALWHSDEYSSRYDADRLGLATSLLVQDLARLRRASDITKLATRIARDHRAVQIRIGRGTTTRFSHGFDAHRIAAEIMEAEL